MEEEGIFLLRRLGVVEEVQSVVGANVPGIILQGSNGVLANGKPVVPVTPIMPLPTPGTVETTQERNPCT
jgi:hypothetical protein